MSEIVETLAHVDLTEAPVDIASGLAAGLYSALPRMFDISGSLPVGSCRGNAGPRRGLVNRVDTQHSGRDAPRPVWNGVQS